LILIMVGFTTDDVKLTIKIGIGATITLPQIALIAVLQRKEDKVDMGDGYRFAVENDVYCFYYKGTCVRMTENEWREVVWFVSDISPPPVYGDMCTLCDRCVISSVHKGCEKRKLKMDLFAATPFGSELINTFVDVVLRKEHRDKEALRRSMAGVQRKDVVAAFGLSHKTLYRYGPVYNVNENILKFDKLFRNFKALVYPIVKIMVKRSLLDEEYL